MMIKNFAIIGLSLLMCISLLMRSDVILGQSNSAVASPRSAEIQSVVAEYSRAVLDQDGALLDRLLHPAASKHEYVRFAPRLTYAFQSHDRDRLVSAPRTSAAEWDSEPEADVITLLGSSEMTAAVSLSGVWGTEFLHLIRANDGWQIIQVLGVDPGHESDSSVGAASMKLEF